MTDSTLKLVGYMNVNSVKLQTELFFRTYVHGKHGKEDIEARVKVVKLGTILVDIEVVEVTKASENFYLEVGKTYKASVSDLYFN